VLEKLDRRVHGGLWTPVYGRGMRAAGTLFYKMHDMAATYPTVHESKGKLLKSGPGPSERHRPCQVELIP
jgi:hypothetical protein